VGWAVAAAILLGDALRPRAGRRGGASARWAGTALGVAVLVALPWLVRNALVYGPADLLALSRHDLVVQGQPTTAALLETTGLGGLLRAGALTTFRSFWGQFGWMGVPMDAFIYQGLAVLSAVAATGLVLLWVSGVGRAAHDLAAAQIRAGRPTRYALGVLVVWTAVTALGYVWWNLRYVQHQGRYLFPALFAIGALFTLGLRAWHAAPLRWTLPVLGAAAAALGIAGVARGDAPATALALVAAAAAALLLQRSLERLLERRLANVAVLAVDAGIWLLALWALYRVIVPTLAI